MSSDKKELAYLDTKIQRNTSRNPREGFGKAEYIAKIGNDLRIHRKTSYGLREFLLDRIINKPLSELDLG